MYDVLESLEYDLDQADSGCIEYVRQVEKNIATVKAAIDNELTKKEQDKLNEVFTTFFEDSDKSTELETILNGILAKVNP